MLPAAIPKRYVVKPRRDIVELGTPSSTVIPCVPEMPEVYADEYKTLSGQLVPTIDIIIERLTLCNLRLCTRR